MCVMQRILVIAAVPSFLSLTISRCTVRRIQEASLIYTEMPLDRPFQDRFDGFFNERRSTAPKIGTSARVTMLAPQTFGGGCGTEPKAKHNLTATPVGPHAGDVPRAHTRSAVFGTASRDSSWMGASPSIVYERRSVTPPSSMRSAPRSPYDRSSPSSSSRAHATTDDIEQRALAAKFQRDGCHTPRAYTPGSKGGAIPRSARKTTLSTVSSPSPGPTSYSPKYGLLY